MAASSEGFMVRGVRALPSRSESSGASPDPGLPDAISASCSPLRANEFSPALHATTNSNSTIMSEAKPIQQPRGVVAMPSASLQRGTPPMQPGAPNVVVKQPPPPSFYPGGASNARTTAAPPRVMSQTSNSTNTGGNFGEYAPAPTRPTPQNMMTALQRGGVERTVLGQRTPSQGSAPRMNSLEQNSKNSQQPPGYGGVYRSAYYVPRDEPVMELKPSQAPSLGMAPTYLASQVRAFEARPGIAAGSSIVIMPPPGTTFEEFKNSRHHHGPEEEGAKKFTGSEGDSDRDDYPHYRHHHRRHHQVSRGHTGGRDRKKSDRHSERDKDGHRHRSQTGHRRHEGERYSSRHRGGETDTDYSRDTHHQRKYTGALTNSDDWDSVKERIECRCGCRHCRRGNGRCSYAESKTRGRRSDSVASSSSSSSSFSSSSRTSSMSSSSCGRSSSIQMKSASKGSSSRRKHYKSPGRNSEMKKNRPDSGKRRDHLKDKIANGKDSRHSSIQVRDRKGKPEDSDRKVEASRRSGPRRDSDVTSSSESSVVSEEAKFFPPQLTHHYFHHYPSLPSKKTNPFPPQGGAVPLRREGFQMPEGNVTTMHHFPLTQKGAANYKTGYPANPATHKQPFDHFRISTFEIAEPEEQQV